MQHTMRTMTADPVLFGMHPAGAVGARAHREEAARLLRLVDAARPGHRARRPALGRAHAWLGDLVRVLPAVFTR